MCKFKSGKYPLGCSSMCWLSWFSGPGFCSCPGFHLGLGPSDCSPGLAFCFAGPWTLLGSAARSSPTIRAKMGCTAHVFTAQGGTRRSKQLTSVSCDVVDHFTRVMWAFRPDVRKKSRKGFPGPLGPGGPKSQKRVQNRVKMLKPARNSNQNPPDRGQSRKSDLVNFRGPDWIKFSELCVLLFS